MNDRVQRDGGTVRRPLSPWSTAVHELLRYLEVVDFPASRLLGVDCDVEILEYVEGNRASTAGSTW